MRDLMFMAIFLPMPLICLIRPWIGVLIWAWFAYTYPNSSLWGFASTLPANMIITASVLLGWILAKDEPKLPPFDRTNLLFIGLALMTAVSIIFSRSPDYTAIKTTEYLSIFLFITLLSIFLRTPERIHALVCMAAFSIGYYAVKSTIFFLASGGANRTSGPVGTQLADNNHLAVACLLVIPLMNYLRLHARLPWVAMCALAAMVLTSLTVISTFSRGGFIGLVCMLTYLWWNSGRKISHVILIAGALTGVIYVSSDAWIARMQTIETAAEEDESFMGRLESWAVYYNAALDRPLTGVGPKSLEDPSISAEYQVNFDGKPHSIAAHSIYFQLMGEEGFVALGLYLLMLFTAWANGGWIARRARDHPDLAWAGDLGRMAQISVVAFAVTASALSLAFFDLLFSIVILLAALRRLVAARLAERTQPSVQDSPAPPLIRPASARAD